VDSESDGDSYKEEEEDEGENGDTAQSTKPLSTVGQWALPTHPEDFKNFIEHGCNLDLQNYLIYPKDRICQACQYRN
jgi:hypothetical protein